MTWKPNIYFEIAKQEKLSWTFSLLPAIIVWREGGTAEASISWLFLDLIVGIKFKGWVDVD